MMAMERLYLATEKDSSEIPLCRLSSCQLYIALFFFSKLLLNEKFKTKNNCAREKAVRLDKQSFVAGSEV
jgi:hypothetical protein